MGGAIGYLFYFYCRSGCQASVVASLLAFHPPEPSYEVVVENITNTTNTSNTNSSSKESEKDSAKDSNGDEKRKKKLTFVLKENNAEMNTGRHRPTVYLVSTNKSGSARIPVLLFRSEGARATLLLSHGNATDLGGMFSICMGMSASLSVNVCAYDYSGYGWTDAPRVQATEQQTYRDISSVYEWLQTEGIVNDPSRELIVYGQSVGSGPSVYLSSRKPVAGLVLHSPFLSGIRVLTASRLLCCFDIFPNIDRISKVKCPVFIIHGQDDREVGFHHGIGLQDRVPGEFKTNPWWVPRRGHNDVLSGNENEFLTRMRDFFKIVEKRNNASMKGTELTNKNNKEDEINARATQISSVVSN